MSYISMNGDPKPAVIPSSRIGGYLNLTDGAWLTLRTPPTRTSPVVHAGGPVNEKPQPADPSPWRRGRTAHCRHRLAKPAVGWVGVQAGVPHRRNRDLGRSDGEGEAHEAMADWIGACRAGAEA